jgi:hypothetical protein
MLVVTLSSTVAGTKKPRLASAQSTLPVYTCTAPAASAERI